MLNSREPTDEEIRETGLRHRVYFPPNYWAEEQALVVLVHGRAGNDQVMWTFSKVLENTKAVVVAPQAPLADAKGGWSWWLVDGNKEPVDVGGDDLFAATSTLASFLDRFCEYHKLTPRVIIGIGFSQGAAVLSALSLTKPSLFSGVAMLAGFVPHAGFEASLKTERASQPHLFVAHGTMDEVIPLDVAENGVLVLKSLGFQVELVTDTVGHKVGVNAQRSLRYWLEKEMSR